MTNLNNDHQNNLVSFLRHNKPVPPSSHPNLEQELFDSLEPQIKSRKSYFKAAWTMPKTIKLQACRKLGDACPKMSAPAKLLATGFLFTSVSFGLKTPQVALEPKDLENFLVRNWKNTLDNNSYTSTKETEAYWLLPTVSEPQQPVFSVSAQ